MSMEDKDLDLVKFKINKDYVEGEDLLISEAKKYSAWLALKSDVAEDSMLSREARKSDVSLIAQHANSSVIARSSVISAVNKGDTSLSLVNVGKSNKSAINVPDAKTLVVGTAIVSGVVALGVFAAKSAKDYIDGQHNDAFAQAQENLKSGGIVNPTNQEIIDEANKIRDSRSTCTIL